MEFSSIPYQETRNNFLFQSEPEITMRYYSFLGSILQERIRATDTKRELFISFCVILKRLKRDSLRLPSHPQIPPCLRISVPEEQENSPRLEVNRCFLIEFLFSDSFSIQHENRKLQRSV